MLHANLAGLFHVSCDHQKRPAVGRWTKNHHACAARRKGLLNRSLLQVAKLNDHDKAHERARLFNNDGTNIFSPVRGTQ
jgi:hypothetical protein